MSLFYLTGRRWGLDAQNSGVYVLPPREKADADLDVYRGTADAISQNIDFVDMFAPEYVLILSGDHIYKMNYDNMLDYHKETGADATIAVIETGESKEQSGIHGYLHIQLEAFKKDAPCRYEKSGFQS